MELTDLIRPTAQHSWVRVESIDKNPTAEQDSVNANLPERLQYPSDDLEQPTVEREPNPLEDEPYEFVAAHHEILRFARVKGEEKRTLKQAQQFFNRQRQERQWKLEAPIYRTARFWCKKIRF